VGVSVGRSVGVGGRVTTASSVWIVLGSMIISTSVGVARLTAEQAESNKLARTNTVAILKVIDFDMLTTFSCSSFG
jgi:hypothetical protein